MLSEQETTRSIADCKVLIVDDQEFSRMIMTSLIEDIVSVDSVESAELAYAYSQTNQIDLVVTDVNMPEKSGRELCVELAMNPATSGIPVIFVTSSNSDEQQEACWAAGGADFVTKPINATTFRNRVKAQLLHKIKADLLETLIFTDRLTGAFNRHYMDERLPNIVKEADREAQPLAVAMFDIDSFKQYNDEYGHISGDSCLWNLTNAVQQVLMRPMDHLIRVGGEEFLVLLPYTTVEGADVVCERILDCIRELKLPHKRSQFEIVTVSIGVAIYEPNIDQDIEQVLLLADQSLYQAKKQGRNRFVRAKALQHQEMME